MRYAQKSISHWIWVSLCLLITQNAIASISAETFQRHMNPVFIETGTYIGRGVRKAIEAGFHEIYSIELAPHLYKKSVQKCKHLKNSHNVQFYLGHSPSVLKQILPNIHENATFWLDAHYQGGNTAMGNTHTPILDELDIIANHHLHTHTIMISDIHLCGTPQFDFITVEELIEALLKINPNYSIYLEDSDIKNDILIAEISK